MSLPGGRAPITGPDNYSLREQLFALRRELAVARQYAAPPKGIIHAYLTAAEVSKHFDTTGQGKGEYAGWAICNGNNGTPDLRDRFVRSVDDASGTTGGSDTSSHTHAIDHDHGSFNSGGTALTTAQLPAHDHGLAVSLYSSTGAANIAGGATLGSSTVTGSSVGGGEAHTHSVDVPAFTGTSGAASATENRPAYYELVALMRV